MATIATPPLSAQLTNIDRREAYRAVAKLCKPDNYTNWFYIGADYAVFILTVWSFMSFYHSLQANGWSWGWSIPAYVLAIAIIGGWVQNRLSVLVHEASHYSLFRTNWLNDLAANLFLLFPVLGVIANYRKGHWGHHRYVNDPERDPDLHRLTQHEPREFPLTHWKFWVNYVAKQLNVWKGISYLIGRAKYVAMPMKQNRKTKPIRNRDSLGRSLVLPLRITYYIVLFTVLTQMGWWPHYFFFWIVPMLTFYSAVLFLREIAHHGNYPDDGDFTNSRVYEANWFDRQVFFPYGEWNHVLHHMFPSIPHHQMHCAHEIMMHYPPYRDQVVTCNGVFWRHKPHSENPSVLEILTHPADTYLRDKINYQATNDIRHETKKEIGG
ncbi:Hypothetical protein PBC10988_34190 [Planctomycetales bacterium 10988]|nr:Hypothetical protein PBC10988_34190 [Planctomycetales bacterium 10988]